MSGSTRRGLLLGLLLGVCCLGCRQDIEAERDENKQRFPPGFKVETYRWTGPMPQGGLIDARNPYGDFRSRMSTDDNVQVSAQIQKLTPDQPDVEFVIEEHADGLIVSVGRAAFEMTELGEGPDDGFPGRIDLTILVPRGSRLRTQTVDGNIQVDGPGMSADVEAITRSGNITLVTRGHVQATSGRGNVRALLGGKQWSRPQALRTTTGKIVVEMLDFAELAVDAHSKGEIRTHFADGLSPAVKRTNGALSFELGLDGRDLSVRSDRGVVELNVVKKLSLKL